MQRKVGLFYIHKTFKNVLIKKIFLGKTCKEQKIMGLLEGKMINNEGVRDPEVRISEFLNCNVGNIYSS